MSRVSSQKKVLSPQPDLRVIEGAAQVPTLVYRPDIDGMRAIAVLSVVIYHLFPWLIPGGFIGVDIFFVISGYLISSIIFKDLELNRFSFISFYSRRIKRIFPALLLILFFVGLLGWLVLLPAEFVSLVKSMKYTTIFSTNWHLFKAAGYFDSKADLKPLLHIWSLSIEEQYYIVFPMLLVLLNKWRKNWLPIVLISGMFLSFVLNVWFLSEQPQRVFYMLPYRAWELLVGATLAYFAKSIFISHKGITNILSAIGIVFLGLACCTLSAKDPFPGYWALLPTIGAAFLIVSPQAFFNRYFLSNPMVVWVGLISYSLYLWHWPMMSFAHILGQDTNIVRMGIFLVSIILASATTFLIERPIRKGPDKWLYVLCIPMLVIGIGASVLSKNPVQTYPLLNASGSALSKFEAATEDWDHDSVTLQIHSERGFPFRTFGSGSHVIMFFGDSNMKQYWPRIERILQQDEKLARTYTALIATFHGQFPCPGYGKNPLANDFLTDAEKCLNDPRIQTVVIGASWVGYQDTNKAILERRYSDLQAMIEKIKSQGKTVYLILNIPIAPETDPMQRLSRGLFYAIPSDIQSFPLSKYSEQYNGIISRLKNIAHATGAIILDPTDSICPNGQCQLLHGEGLPTYKDSCHLTATYARSHALFIDRIFIPSL